MYVYVTHAISKYNIIKTNDMQMILANAIISVRRTIYDIGLTNTKRNET